MRKISLAIAVAFACLSTPAFGQEMMDPRKMVELDAAPTTVEVAPKPIKKVKRSYVTSHCAARADNLKAYPRPYTAFGNVTNSLFICRDR